MTKHIHSDDERESPSLALLRQADEAGVRLTHAMAEGVANGRPRMMAYVAGLIAVRGRRPVVQPRFDGGPVRPGQVYTGNEQGPESVVTADGRSQPLGDGRPSTFTVSQPAVVVPHEAETKTDAVNPSTTNPTGGTLGPPQWDDTGEHPGSLGGPMPVILHTNGSAPAAPEAPRQPMKDPGRTLGNAQAPRPAAMPDYSSQGQPLSPVHKAMIDNAILALDQTPAKGYAEDLKRMVKEGRVRIDPGLDQMEEYTSGRTWFGGGGFSLNPRLFTAPSNAAPGSLIAAIAENLAHEYEHTRQWKDPLRRERQAFQEGYLRFGPYVKPGSDGGTWGPLEWQPHETGHQVYEAVKGDYDKHYVHGDRRFPIAPYLTRQGWSGNGNMVP